MTSFYVYESWTNGGALVHRGDCGHCNNGKGSQGRGRKTLSGEWHGPFPTSTQALAVARRLGASHPEGLRWDARRCQVCG